MAGERVARTAFDRRPAHHVGQRTATIATHQDYKTVTRNDATRNVEVTNGKLSAGIHVVALQDKVSQLVIASVIPPGGESATSFAVGNVLRICKEMKVECTLEGSP